MSTVYAVYCVSVDVGWLGVFLSINLAFFSNDLFSYLLQVYDGTSEDPHLEEQRESGTVPEGYSEDGEYSSPASESENLFSCKSSSKETSPIKFVNNQNDSSPSKVVKADSSSIDEMKRILNSLDHYGALGFPRNKSIDVSLLRKEYRRKVCLLPMKRKKNSNNKEVRDCLLVFAYDTRYLKIGYLFILLLIQYLIFMCKIRVLLYPWHVPTASVLYLGKIGFLYDSSMMASLSLFHV